MKEDACLLVENYWALFEELGMKARLKKCFCCREGGELLLENTALLINNAAVVYYIFRFRVNVYKSANMYKSTHS